MAASRKRPTRAERAQRQAAREARLAKVEGRISLGDEADRSQFSGWVQHDEFNDWVGNIVDEFVKESYDVTWGRKSAQEAADALRRAWEKDRAKLLAWRRESPRYCQKTKLH